MRRYSLALAATLLFVAAPARGDDTEEAKTHYKRATSAYALGDYPGAAREYEAAFKLEPDKALLYNAAQAHRLAGHDQRAIELYQSYLRMPGPGNRAEVEHHIANLKAAMEKQRSAASAPPLTTAPLKSREEAEPVETAPQVETTPSISQEPTPTARVEVAKPAATSRPWYKRGWVWGVVAGVVVVGVAVGVGAGVGAKPGDPSASLGAVKF